MKFRQEDSDLVGDADDREIFWFSRIADIRPQMYQIFIEAIASPNDLHFTSRVGSYEMSFNTGLAIRGKNAGDEDWNVIYSSFTKDSLTDHMSQVTVSCQVEENTKSRVCDSFELGIIGYLEYEMYDIAIMIASTPEKLLGRDLASISFRLSYYNDTFLTWFASMRLCFMGICSAILLLFFVTSCSLKGVNISACSTFNLDQACVSSLLLACIFFNDPFFELRRSFPSIAFAVLAEVPASLFYTTLLTYWLLGITHVRVRVKTLRERRRQATLQDITGVLSVKRVIILVAILVCFVLA